MAFYCHYLVGFFVVAFSSIHQLSPHKVNKGGHLMLEPGILLPLPVWSWLLHFLYRVDVHPYSVRVNILSSWLYRAAPLGDQTWYPTQSHYPDAEPTKSYPHNDKRLDRKRCASIFKSLVWLEQGLSQRLRIPRSTKTGDGRARPGLEERPMLSLLSI